MLRFKLLFLRMSLSQNRSTLLRDILSSAAHQFFRDHVVSPRQRLPAARLSLSLMRKNSKASLDPSARNFIAATLQRCASDMTR
ncbi:hypothetical protein [Ensifer adhaerens]|uniref:hypothetical protein n=1 Tax=Ensifer adhaerens TaxID=106592 RepID=UPI0013792876|nr:hypothetical protein [Ensifer adhaerens]